MTAEPQSRLLTAEPQSRLLRFAQGPKVKILVSFGIGQVLIFATSVARIPLIIHSIGASGYGLLLAVTALAPWMLLVIGGLNNVARVDIAEALGAAGEQSAWATLEHHRRRSYRLCAWVGALSILAALVVPWNSLLLSQHGLHLAPYEVPLGIAVSGVMVALSAPGSVYQGLLQADRRVVITSILPGAAAILSLVVTAAAAVFSAPFVVFVLATVAASCAPFWFAHILGLSHRAKMQRRVQDRSVTAHSRAGNTLDLVIMTGAAAPPLFSVGWDPLVLGAAAGPEAVAVYGLASRLAALVTILPSALYPHFWAEYARLRAAGEGEALRAHLRRDIIIVTGLTAALGVLYIGIGPIVGAILGRHAVDQPRSLYVAFAVMGVLAALQTVVLPVLGGRRSAWLMATLVFAFTLPNVALSYVLSLRVGAVGPVLASIFFSILLLGGAWACIHRRPELLIDTSEVPEPRSLHYAMPPTSVTPLAMATSFSRLVTAIQPDAAERRGKSAAVGAAPSAVGCPPYVEVVTRVWRRAAWAAAAAYFLGSPSLTIVANGSTARGAILAFFPLVASVLCFVGVQRPMWRGGRELMVPAAFAAVVVWQFLSAYFNIGSGYIMHALPAVTLLMLGLRIRAVQYELSIAEFRRCLASLLGPLMTILLLGLVLQMVGKIPSEWPSDFPLSVHGYRLQGLAIHPIGEGLLAGLTLLLALAARGNWVRLTLYRSITVAILILTDARTAWVGTLAAVVFMWLLEPQRSTWRRLLPILVTMMALPAIASFVLIERASSGGNVLTGRNIIWQNTLPLLRQLHVFGYGPQAIARLFPDIGGAGSMISQAQNQWLDDAINFGWVGPVLLVALCLSISLAGPLSHRRMLLFSMLIYILVVSFSEEPLDLWNSTVQAFPLFLTFIVTSRGRNPLLESADPPTGGKGVFR